VTQLPLRLLLVMSVHSQAIIRYNPLMPASSRDAFKYRLVGAGAVLSLGVVHGIHDILHGDAIVRALLPTLTIALQVVALSYGHTLALRRRWSSAITLTLAMLVCLVGGMLTVTLHSNWPSTLQGALLAAMFAGLGVLMFWLLVFFFPGQLMEARTQALAAESERRRAELARLRANLHPHFVLNTLNAIAGLLVTEPRQSRRLVVALGDLLRDSLEDEGEMRSLEHDVQWLRRYAEIFEIRHAGAIHFEWDLAPETLGVPLPRLLLQPLLENAIEHRALQRAGGGTVTLRSRTAGDAIQIAVSDDGPGMASNRPSGLGLRLVEDRLHLAYPRARLVMDSHEAGTCVTLDLPKPKEAR
jgi:signal transduction histidine kinase